MSDLAVSWVAVAPSAWQRRLHSFALVLTFGTLGVCTGVHLSDSVLIAASAGGCAMLAAACLAQSTGANLNGEAWSVAADGRVSVRRDERVWRDATVVFVSAAFVVVRADGRSLGIWRDATPFRAFRRLSVAARWRTSGSPPCAC